MLKLSDDDFYRVVNFIKTNYGINLEKKRILIESRLTGIAAARGYDNFTDYLDHALNDSGRTLRPKLRMRYVTRQMSWQTR